MRIRVLALLLLVLAGCSAGASSAPEVVEDFWKDMNAYDATIGGLEHNDQGVATPRALLDWDRALSGLESSYSEMSTQLDRVEASNPILTLEDALGVWLDGQREQLNLTQRCYSSASDPSACALRGFIGHFEQRLQEDRNLRTALSRAQGKIG